MVWLNVSVLFTGRRWLSGPNNPQGCNDICGNGGHPQVLCFYARSELIPTATENEQIPLYLFIGCFQLCVDPSYLFRTDYDVWYPLEFKPDGSIAPMRHLDSFTLSLP